MDEQIITTFQNNLHLFDTLLNKNKDKTLILRKLSTILFFAGEEYDGFGMYKREIAEIEMFDEITDFKDGFIAKIEVSFMNFYNNFCNELRMRKINSIKKRIEK